MSSASASARTARRARPATARARRSARSGPASSTGLAARVRWDRLGRVAMLGVLIVLGYLYLSAGAHLWSTWHQARSASVKVASMERENRALKRQHEALGSPGAVEAQARALGMMKHGEQPYIISGLPNN
jgi:cell division protein FtsB